jgi:hypothetical protein
MDKQIVGLIKQNKSIYDSLISKEILNVPDLIILTELMSLDEQKNLLLEENKKLKDIVKENKPIQELTVKENKSIQKLAVKEKPKDEDNDNDLYEDNAKDTQPKFSTITNMEDIKRSFFSGDYNEFKKLVSLHPFKMYSGEYLYASDKDGSPDYSARNLVKGFVRNFDDYRKYFMICFRCYQHQNETNTYTYPSLWILNSNDCITNILGSSADDYKLTEILPEQIDNFLKSFEKITDETTNIIAENYVH